MQYAILCYNNEAEVFSWSKEKDATVMADLGLGPVARLMPTSAATTIRKDRDPPLVLDGPFAETKEQLLGFYILDCANLDEAIDAALELGRANPGGSYEVRPLSLFRASASPE